MSQSFNATQNKGQTQTRNSQSFNARHTKGHTQARTEEWMEATKGTTTNEPRHTLSSDSAQLTAHHSEHSAHQDNQEPAGFLQQTGEKMVHMAQDAVDTVKETLGMNEKK